MRALNHSLWLSLLLLCLAAPLMVHSQQPARTAIQILGDMRKLSIKLDAALQAGLVQTVGDGEKVGEIAATTTTIAPQIQTLINDVNQLRQEYFATFQSIDQRKEFAAREIEREKERSGARKTVVILRIASCESAVRLLLPELLSSFLAFSGYEGVRTRSEGAKLIVSGQQVGDVVEQAIEVTSMTNAECYSALFNESSHACITSRPIHDTEISKLSESQRKLADLKLPSYVTPLGQTGAMIVRPRKGQISLGEIGFAITQLKRVHVVRSHWGLGELDDFLNAKLGIVNGQVHLIAHSTQEDMHEAIGETDELGLLRFSQGTGADADEMSFTTIPEYKNPKRKPLFLLNVEGGTTNAPVKPTVINIRTEEYPLAQPLQLSVTIHRKPLIKALQHFMRTEAAPLIRKAGWIPTTAVEAAAKEEWVKEAEATSERYSKPIEQGGIPGYGRLIAGCDRASTPFVLHFIPGKADVDLYSNLNPQALPNIRNLVFDLASHGWSDREAVLIGHTDSTGSNNKALGNERVKSMKLELESMGVPVEELQPEPSLKLTEKEKKELEDQRDLYGNSLGKIKPIANESTSQGKDQNRRVEIWMRTKMKLAPAKSPQ